MKSKLLSVAKYILLLAVAAGLLAFAFRGISVKVILQDILQAKMSWLLLSVAAGVIAFVSRAHRWNLLIEPLGYSPPLRKTSYALMVGYLANLAFPRLGEVTRCGSLSKTESIPFSSLLGTVIVERVIDVISLLICVLLTTIIEYKRLGSFLSVNIFQPIAEKWMQLIGSPIVIISVVVIIAALFFALYYFVKKSKQKGGRSKLVQIVKGLIDGMRSVSKLKRPWLFMFHTLLIWVLYFLGVYICFFALPATSHLGLSAGLLLLVVGGLGMSAPVQGGIGVYHLLVSQGLMLYGLTQHDGLTFATLVHTLSLLLVVILGIVSLFLLFSENKKRATTRTAKIQSEESSI